MTPKRIIAAVAFAAGTTPARLCDLKSPAFARCRYVAMHIMTKRFPDLKHMEIASVFGHESNTPVSRANAFLAKAKSEKAPAAALMNLATGLLEGKKAAWQVVPMKLWVRRRKDIAAKPVRTARKRRTARKPPIARRSDPEVVQRLPGSPRGWLLTEKRVAALYQKRNYRGPVAQQRRVAT